MLRVTVELVPFGDESMARRLGGCLITNTGKGDARTGHYEVWETLASGGQRGNARLIRRYPRSFGWLPLVFMAFQTIANDWRERKGNKTGFPWKDPDTIRQTIQGHLDRFDRECAAVFKAAQEKYRG